MSAPTSTKRFIPGSFDQFVASGHVAGMSMKSPSGTTPTFIRQTHNFIIKSAVILSFLQISFLWFCGVTFLKYKSSLVLFYFIAKFWFFIACALLPFFAFMFYYVVRLVASLWHVDTVQLGEVQSVALSYLWRLGHKCVLMEGRGVICPGDWSGFFGSLGRFFTCVLAPITTHCKNFQKSRGVVVPTALLLVPSSFYNVVIDAEEPIPIEHWLPLALSVDRVNVAQSGEQFVEMWNDDALYSVHPLASLTFIVCRFWALCSLSTFDVVFLPLWFGLFVLSMFFLLLKLFYNRVLKAIFDLLIWWFLFINFVYWTPAIFWEYWLLSIVLFVRPILSLCFKILFFVIWPRNWPKIKAFFRLSAAGFSIWILNFGVWAKQQSRRRVGGSRNAFLVKTRMTARFNNMWISVQQRVADINLPGFVRTAAFPFDKENIERTLRQMEELGWPVNVTTRGYTSLPEDSEFPGWDVTGITFDQGMRQLMTFVDHELEQAEINNEMVYKRSESYQTLANEFKATSRYFKVVDYNFADLEVDEVWTLVGEIFAESRLTPFSTIIRRWEKKYGLAVFARKYNPVLKKDVKLKRRDFIKRVGRRDFEALWARTFEVGQGMVPLAPVSVKAEALPPKKWLADKVRTVIGAPITHYITSTVFNYAPNHNFKPFSTPIKVGLPLSGFGMTQVFNRHSVKELHFAGDCSEFDSTLSGKIRDIVVGVRKKGFENHRDYKRICDLIEREYQIIENQLLARTTIGSVNYKGTGFSTGHSSTSMDNSIAMVSLYLMAWKELTGLSAHDFRHHVELSVYGDDHLISWSHDVPPTWTFGNIQRAMAGWGITMNLEGQGELSTLEFLSKYGRKPTSADKTELISAGIPVPDWVIFHNPAKLVGKLKTPVLSNSLVDQNLRLKGYLLLTAHNKKLYDEIVGTMAKKTELIRRTQPTYKITIPSYVDVLTMWYSPSDKPHPALLEAMEIEPSDDSGEILEYGSVTIIDAFLNLLSRVVDVVNPDVYNSSLSNFLQRPLLPFSLWAIRFIREANFAHTTRHVAQLLNKSCYDWLSSEAEIPLGEDPSTATSRLFKHWVYMLLRSPPGGILSSKTILWVDKKLADFKFAMTGHIVLSVRRLDVPIWNMVLLAGLGAIPDLVLPDWRELPYLRNFLSFDVGSFVDGFMTASMNSFFASTPPSFSATIHSIRSLKAFEPFWLQAATGTGKTTVFVSNLVQAGLGYKHIVVVVPRSMIVKGVVKYMADNLVSSVTGYTLGMIGDPNAFVKYVTPMELDLHPEWQGPDTLLILDEAHVEEPLYEYIKCLIRKRCPYSIWMTATPPDGVVPNASLAIANVWMIENLTSNDFIRAAEYSHVRRIMESAKTYNDGMLGYLAFVSLFLDNANPYSRSLVFVNSIIEGEDLKGRLRGTHINGGVCFISSNNTDIPKGTGIIITTSVSDVGVTISDVDHVITPSVILEVRPSRLTGQTAPRRFVAPNQLLTQRRGRTGRTNNGRFIKFYIPGGDPYERWPSVGLVVNCLASGVSMDSLVAFCPHWLVDLQIGHKVPEHDYLNAVKKSWVEAKRFRLDHIQQCLSNSSLAMAVVPEHIVASLDRAKVNVDVELPEYWKPTAGGIVPAARWSVANEFGAALVNISALATTGKTMTIYQRGKKPGLHLTTRDYALEKLWDWRWETLEDDFEDAKERAATKQNLIDKLKAKLASSERELDGLMQEVATVAVRFNQARFIAPPGADSDSTPKRKGNDINSLPDNLESWANRVASLEWSNDFVAALYKSPLVKKYPSVFTGPFSDSMDDIMAHPVAFKAFKKFYNTYEDDHPFKM